MAELVFNISLAGFLVAMLFVSRTFRDVSVEGDLLKSGGFPALLIIIGLCLLAFIVFNQLRKKSLSAEKIIDLKTKAGKTIVINILTLTAYIFMIDFIGYTVSTFFFAFFSAFAMGYRKYRLLIAYAVLVTVIFVIVFGKIFYVPLPRGTGLLRELTYYIY